MNIFTTAPWGIGKLGAMTRVAPGVTATIHSLLVDTHYNGTTGQVVALLTTGSQPPTVFIRVAHETLSCSMDNVRATASSREPRSSIAMVSTLLALSAVACAMLWKPDYLYEATHRRE